MYLPKIYVTLKSVVNDHQRLIIKGTLHGLGFGNITSVWVGKYMEIQMGGNNLAKAKEQVPEMCCQLLANLVIENFRFELEKI